MAGSNTKQVTFHLRRFKPGKDAEPHWEDHSIEVTPGMTVLDGLWKVKELSAPSLAWRSSCRMGICGSCGMLINGRPRLACNTQVSELGSAIVARDPDASVGGDHHAVERVRRQPLARRVVHGGKTVEGDDPAAVLGAVVPRRALRGDGVAFEHPVTELAANRQDAPEEPARAQPLSDPPAWPGWCRGLLALP